MNDRQDPYGEQQFYGYDEYGRPVYHDPYAAQPAQPTQPAYDPYAAQQDYGYDPYAQPGQPGSYDPSGQQQYGYDPYAQQVQHTQHTQQAQQQTQQQQWVPQQPQAPRYEEYGGYGGYGDYGDGQPQQPEQTYAPQQPQPQPQPQPQSQSQPQPQSRPEAGESGYQTEQFSFIEEDDEESEDVIDWLKFSESRTERREEVRRRGRNRVVALVVVLALALAGGVGYLWYAGKLPGLSGDDDTAAASGGAEKRDVIVVHLRDIDSDEVSTALLVNNETAGRGTTVLLPNSLALSGGDGTTTLGKSFDAAGAGATRDALDTLLGSDIQGTWRLDTPYLENLVELVGGITVDADVTVPGAKKGDKPLVNKGSARELDGRDAVGYATYRAEGEPQTKQLARFGQVMQAALKELSTDPDGATSTVEQLGQIPDPSLTDKELGSALATLSEHVEKGAYKTELLPVQANGTLSDKTAEGLVKDVLGGKVENSDPEAALRVSVKNASGTRGAADTAQVALVNGGYTVVSTGAADSATASSTVTYSGKGDKERAEEVAKTLGLSAEAAEQGKTAANADVTVVLGKDYEG